MKTLLSLCFIFFALSCNTWKGSIVNSGGKKQVIENIILDYSNSEKSKKKSVYYITELPEEENLYAFYIIRSKSFYTNLKDSIGKYPIANFPTEYYEHSNRLFLIRNKKKKISKEIIEKMNSYNFIDSTYIKIRSGELSEKDIPTTQIDFDPNLVYYLVCKEDISKYIKSREKFFYKKHEESPKLDCN